MGLFSNLFTKKNGSVLGIDIGMSSIKAVQLSLQGGKAVLETYGELALGPYGSADAGRAISLSPEKTSEAVRDLIRESKITADSCGVAIPFTSSLISVIELPAGTEKQLNNIMPIEARKYVPVPISEVSLDWSIIPKAADREVKFSENEESKTPADDKLDILLVAIHNEALTRYQTIVSQASLEASFFEIEIFSTIRSVVEQDTVTRMIVDMGAAATKVYIVERGVIRASHIVNRGSQDITLTLSTALGVTVQEAEIMKRDLSRIPETQRKNAVEVIGLMLDHVFSEANRVLVTYQKRFNKDISEIIMVGGGARLQGILSIAESHFQTEVALGAPFSKTQAPAFLEEVLRNTGPEFAVAVGVALRKIQEDSR